MQRSAQGAFTLIELMIVIAIIAIIAAIAIPNLLDARKAANEANCIAFLRSYHSAQNIYREQDKDGNGTLDYAENIKYLLDAGLLPRTSELINPFSTMQVMMSNGYVHISGSDWYTSTLFTWCAKATAEEPGESGDRYFFIDHTGVIRYSLWDSSVQSIAIQDWPAIGK